MVIEQQFRNPAGCFERTQRYWGVIGCSIVLCLSATLSACGGGSSGNSDNTQAPGSAPGTSVSPDQQPAAASSDVSPASSAFPTSAASDPATPEQPALPASSPPSIPATPVMPASGPASETLPAVPLNPASSPVVTVSALPLVTITTDAGAPIVDKINYIGADLTIAGTDGSASFSGRTTIKGRGNSTWDLMPKKPYRIKLDAKAGLLGMPKDKNWVLLANYADKTLLRNRTAFEVGNRFAMAWTPRSVPVEVTLNGEYLGAYDLVESVRVDPNRINIADTDDTVAPASTGYVLELNNRMDDPICWKTTQQVPFCIDTPDPTSAAQVTYIEDFVKQAEDALFSANAIDPNLGYEKFIDVNSVIDWYLINELFKNNDAALGLSTYIYKDVGGKLTFGPIWDFDLSAGNINYTDAQYPSGFWISTATWIARMKAIDPTFEVRVRARWRALKVTQIDTLKAFIDRNSLAMALAQKRNFERWPILSTYVWPNAVVTGSYQGEVDYMESWLQQRIAWLDTNL